MEASATCWSTGEPARQSIEERGYTPHVKGRGQEANELKREPDQRARRWIVEIAHSWLNRFRRLLVRHEKLHCTYVALNLLAAAIIAFRKIPLTVNVIYGYALSQLGTEHRFSLRYK